MFYCERGRIKCDASVTQQENCGLKCQYENLNEFYEAYCRCAMWTECPEHRCVSGEFADDLFEELLQEVPPAVLETMRKDCADFIKKHGHMIPKEHADQAGHDFWLSRNGHGTGFWDRREIWGKHTNTLDKAAHDFGEFYDLYFDEDSEG